MDSDVASEARKPHIRCIGLPAALHDLQLSCCYIIRRSPAPLGAPRLTYLTKLPQVTDCRLRHRAKQDHLRSALSGDACPRQLA